MLTVQCCRRCLLPFVVAAARLIYFRYRAGGRADLSLNLIGGACRRPRRNRKFIVSKNNAELLQKGGSECEGGKRYIPSSNNKTERKQIFKPPRSSRSANSITFIFLKDTLLPKGRTKARSNKT